MCRPKNVKNSDVCQVKLPENSLLFVYICPKFLE